MMKEMSKFVELEDEELEEVSGGGIKALIVIAGISTVGGPLVGLFALGVYNGYRS